MNSAWIREFQTAVLRRKHVVLHGNVLDYCLWNDSYITVGQFLRNFFAEQGFDVIASYDEVDGYRFDEAEHRASPLAQPNQQPLPDDMRARFFEIVRRSVASERGAAPPAAQPAAPAAPADPTAPPPRQAPGRASPQAAASNQRIPPLEAFAQIRHALRQPQSSVAAIVELGDLLTVQTENYGEGERQALVTLRRGMEDAAVIPEGRASGCRNTVVLLATNGQKVPAWLYRDNPHVALVQVGVADKDERVHYARTFMRPQGGFLGFFGGGELSETPPNPREPSQFELAVEELANLTEGFTVIDLEALRRASHIARRPVLPGHTRQLVDYFKFGEQDDPWEKVDAKRIAEAGEVLQRRVIGQPRAIQSVVDMLYASRLGVSMTGSSKSAKPKGVFFFVGPTGVGKTELAKTLTEFVFGDDRAFARFDMSEYQEEHAAAKLIGAPPGYVGYDEGGQLTRRMQERPHSILLFDEVEKGHPRVLDKFLQILEDGRLTDGKGQTVFFNQAVIIFTSNIGAAQLGDQLAQVGIDGMTPEAVAAHFDHYVKQHFINDLKRPELLNRLGENIVVFDFLRPAFVRGICDKFCRLFIDNAQTKLRCQIIIAPSLSDWIERVMAEGDKLAFGGRRVKTELEMLFERAFPRWVFQHQDDPKALEGRTLTLGVDDVGQLQVDVR